MIEKVYKYIKENNLLNKKDNIVLAVSGGADSIFMLNILNEINIKYNLNFNFIICHLNHMIREEALYDLQYVKEFSEKLDIKFISKSVDIIKITKELKKSEEEVGRLERYKFFNEIGNKYFGKNQFKICTAHNLNDNTETILLNLMRGTGIDGLTGIDLINNNVVRPILFMDRKDIENYLDNNNIKYIVDKTNLESEYTRNSVRNELLPFIKEKYNSNIDETIFRMSQIVKDEKELLDNLTKDTLEKILIKTVLKNDTKIKSVKIDLNLFNKENIALRRRILRYIINNYFNIYKNISKINIDDAIKLAYNNIGNKYTLLNKDIKVSVLKGVLTIEQI